MTDAVSKTLDHLPIAKTHPLWTLGISVAIIAGIALLLNLLLTFIVHIIDKRNDKSTPKILFYNAFLKPIRIAVWIIALWLICRLNLALLDFTWLKWLSGWGDKLAEIGLVITLTWASLTYAKKLRDYFFQKYTRTDGGYSDYSLIETIYVASRIAVFLITGFLILSLLNISIFALSGVIGAIGIAFTISQQELIKNLIGGLVIYLDRPFSVGDWIRNESGSIEGTVEKISFRLTKLIAFDSQPIYVPNATFLNTAVVNCSRMKNRRILQYIGVRYEDIHRLPAILEEITKMLKVHPDINTKSTILVCMLNGSTGPGAYGPYSLNFMVYAFTKTVAWARFQKVQDDVLFKVGQIIHQHGAQIAFPTQTLDIPTPVAIDAANGQNLKQPRE